QPGMPCEITTDAYPNLMFKGTVDQIAPQATLEQNVSTFQVDIAVDTANPQPTSGGGRMDFRGTFAGMKGGGGGGRGGPMGAGGMRRAMGAGGARPGGGRSGGGTPSGPRPDAPAPEAPAVAPTLRAGMTATAEIIVSSYEEAPVIPLRYLQYDDEGKPFVWLWPAGTPPPEPPTEEEDEQADAPKPGEGPQPTKAYVEIGYTDGVSYAIKSGIKPGDILVVEQEVEMEATFGAFGIRQQKKSSR
ncbi:MAG TPA: hypothetical protein VEI97_03555, partial [bacterium]|nr:hypothetical protein [bacterium]